MEDINQKTASKVISPTQQFCYILHFISSKKNRLCEDRTVIHKIDIKLLSFHYAWRKPVALKKGFNTL